MAALAEVDPLQALIGMDPPTQLADHLLPPLKRRALPFDLAWELAMGAVRWPGSIRDASDWRKMLHATREGWRAAYDDEPATRPEWVLRGLAAGLAKIADAA